MALADFKKVNFDDRVTSKFQDNVSEYFSHLNKVTLDGVLLEKTQGLNPIEITISTTTTLVAHGLKRAFNGWYLVDIQGDARVWRDATYTTDSDKYLPLVASSAVKVKLWVF